MRKIICLALTLLMFSSVAVSATPKENVHLTEENFGLSMELDDKVEEIELTALNRKNLPNQVKKHLQDNPDHKLVESIVEHYRLEENEKGEVEKKLLKSFQLKDDKSVEEYKAYRDNIEVKDIGTMSKPRQGAEIFLGLTRYSFSHPSSATAYQIQGWWEWDPSALGVFTARWDVVGLNFQGQTQGYDYFRLANNIFNGGSIQLNLQNSDDNGVAYAHTSTSALSEGAVLGKVISDRSVTSDRFRVYFIYEHFGSNPSPSYLSQLVDAILGNFLPSLPPLPSQNERFTPSLLLPYGNNN